MASQKRDPKTDPRAALGEALRQLRQAVALSQSAAAAQIDGYGEDAISKAETGTQVPVNDLWERLLVLYQVTSRERVILDVMLATARNSEPVIRESAEQWVKLEPKAAIIRAWAKDILPGLTQAYDYAFAMFRKGGMDEDTAATRADARVKRAEILGGNEPTRLTAIIHESILHCRVGTSETMVGALEHLLDLMDRPGVIIQVVREADYFSGHDGAFEIASGRTIPDTLNLSNIEDSTTTAPAVVDRAIMLFETIRGYALSVAESRALIQEAIQQWKNRQ